MCSVHVCTHLVHTTSTYVQCTRVLILLYVCAYYYIYVWQGRRESADSMLLALFAKLPPQGSSTALAESVDPDFLLKLFFRFAARRRS